MVGIRFLYGAIDARGTEQRVSPIVLGSERRWEGGGASCIRRAGEGSDRYEDLWTREVADSRSLAGCHHLIEIIAWIRCRKLLRAVVDLRTSERRSLISSSAFTAWPTARVSTLGSRAILYCFHQRKEGKWDTIRRKATFFSGKETYLVSPVGDSISWEGLGHLIICIKRATILWPL